MPTLASIGVHPQLREKLAKLEPPIETPQGLLSRDPSGLAQTIGVPLHHLLDVRSAVADALISKEGHGKRALHVQATLMHFPCNIKQDCAGDNNDGKMDSTEQKDNEAARDCRPSSLILGSVSALDLCLYESLRGDHSRSLSTGSSQLDQLLSFPREVSSAAIHHPRKRSTCENAEGIPFGYVTQVTGPPASGKTQLALMAAANHASKQSGISVHYLASGVGQGALLPLVRRLTHFGRHKQTIKQVLRGTAFVTVSNGYDALAALSEIESTHLQKQTNEQVDGSSSFATLIVLDSVSGCLSGDLYASGDGGVGAFLVHQVASTLKRMARQYGAAVLVTNGTVSADGNSVKAAMGQSWKGADLNLWLTIDDAVCDRKAHDAIPGLSVSTTKTIRATLERHPAKPTHGNNIEERSVKFSIAASGIIDRQ